MPDKGVKGHDSFKMTFNYCYISLLVGLKLKKLSGYFFHFNENLLKRSLEKQCQARYEDSVRSDITVGRGGGLLWRGALGAVRSDYWDGARRVLFFSLPRHRLKIPNNRSKPKTFTRHRRSRARSQSRVCTLQSAREEILHAQRHNARAEKTENSWAMATAPSLMGLINLYLPIRSENIFIKISSKSVLIFVLPRKKSRMKKIN